VKHLTRARTREQMLMGQWMVPGGVRSLVRQGRRHRAIGVSCPGTCKLRSLAPAGGRDCLTLRCAALEILVVLLRALHSQKSSHIGQILTLHFNHSDYIHVACELLAPMPISLLQLSVIFLSPYA
jgi:hypothetical protein